MSWQTVKKTLTVKIIVMILELPSVAMERQKTDVEERAYKHLTLMRVGKVMFVLDINSILAFLLLPGVVTFIAE